MKTKNIPSIIMLFAGAITSVITYLYHYTIKEVLIILLVVLVIFYIIGIFVKEIIDYLMVEKKADVDDEGKVIEKESDLTEEK